MNTYKLDECISNSDENVYNSTNAYNLDECVYKSDENVYNSTNAYNLDECVYKSDESVYAWDEGVLKRVMKQNVTLQLTQQLKCSLKYRSVWNVGKSVSTKQKHIYVFAASFVQLP